MVIGKYEMNIWRDPGKPYFRVYFEKAKPLAFSGYRTYFWVFKLMSFYTLWVAKFDMGTPHNDQTILAEWLDYKRLKLWFFLNRQRIKSAMEWLKSNVSGANDDTN